MPSWVDSNKRVECAPQFAVLEKPRLRVAVVPNHEFGLKNRLFAEDFVSNTQWMAANLEWRRFFHKNGIELLTHDLLPIDQADVVICIDLPEKRSRVAEIRQLTAGKKLILYLLESPFKKPYFFLPENHSEFDKVVTYNPHLCTSDRYKRFYVSVDLGKQVPLEQSGYSQRKIAAMVNTNYYTGIRSYPRPWNIVGYYRKLWRDGWQFGFNDILKSERCLQYMERQRVARAAERFPQGILDIYGAGWAGRKSGWFYRFFPDRPYRDALGPFQGSNLEIMAKYRFVLAFENYASDEGYISEKFFDPILAGAVPIYCGDKKILNHFDRKFFVDARQFKNHIELLEFARDCPESEWESMRQAGRNFLISTQAEVFCPKHFANVMLEAVLK